MKTDFSYNCVITNKLFYCKAFALKQIEFEIYFKLQLEHRGNNFSIRTNHNLIKSNITGFNTTLMNCIQCRIKNFHMYPLGAPSNKNIDL